MSRITRQLIVEYYLHWTTSPRLRYLFQVVQTQTTTAYCKILPTLDSGVTLYQGAPGSKFSKAPLVEVPKARVEHRICTSFLGGPGQVHPENFWIYTLWNAISWTLGRGFTEFWWSENDIVTYQRPWPMFLLYRLNLGPPFGPLRLGAPGFSRSEPIVATPLTLDHHVWDIFLGSSDTNHDSLL
jgi:hypothetical protein